MGDFQMKDDTHDEIGLGEAAKILDDVDAITAFLRQRMFGGGGVPLRPDNAISELKERLDTLLEQSGCSNH